MQRTILYSTLTVAILLLSTLSFGQATEEEITIEIGSLQVSTSKFTPRGTPVVPMWNTQMAKGDLRQGAGFPILQEAQHAMVWQPSSKEEGAYNHYSSLIFFKGKFYAMWGNHPFGEDGPGQRILFSTASRWDSWSGTKELFPAPGAVLSRKEKGIHLKADRWVIVDDTLYAVVFVHGAGIYPIARSVGENGELGEPFLLENLPAKGSLPLYMGNSAKEGTATGQKILEWYRNNSQISWWAGKKWGVERRGVDGAKLIESFSYRAKDGTVVLMLRNWGTPTNPVHNNRIYVSFKRGNKGWSTPYPTDIPDSPSRGQALSLEDGRVLLIGSQNVELLDKALYLDRDPLTLSVSSNGFSFHKVYALRTNSPKSFRFKGVGGRNPGFAYTSSIVERDTLYTLYSIGKEDIAITRLPLSVLELY
ncbi:MAG: exo-alpha-sialidase [Bacteroidales bacterium]